MRSVIKSVMWDLLALGLVLLALALIVGPMTSLMAVAQGAVQVSQPSFLDGILNWINANSGGPVVASGLMIAEFLLRLVPTKTALSILVPVRYSAVGLAAVFGFAGDVLGKLTILGNNVKP